MKSTLPSFNCRFCSTALEHTVVNLGTSPLCESYVHKDDFNKPEPFFPLHVYVCHECFLAQIDEFVPPEEIFTEYAYFSSYSDSWVQHAKEYCEMIAQRQGLGAGSQVVELASNDGYLLQHFKRMGIPAQGVEPAANVAKVAQEQGIDTIVDFFGTKLASSMIAEGPKADLVLGNNVLAQVPDLNDFVAGMSILLADDGIVTMEFPHLMKLIEENQFDTIYHEHYCYFSLIAAEAIFAKHGIRLFDVEEIPTHGGSLRIYGCPSDSKKYAISSAYKELMALEVRKGYRDMAVYEEYSDRVIKLKSEIIEFFVKAQREGKSLAAYGAAGKGNTLLNYCGVKSDWLPFTCDRNPYKQGRYLPGSRVPILAPEAIEEHKPDYVIIMPWNIKHEIRKQLGYISQWGGQFVTFIPELQIMPPEPASGE